MKIKQKLVIVEKNCSNGITVLNFACRVRIRASKTNISLWEFSELRDLTNCFKRLLDMPQPAKCTVYSRCNAYRVKIASDNRLMFSVLGEYAERISPTKYQADMTKRYWKKIIDVRAIETLAELCV